MRTATAQGSVCICAVLPEPSLFHTHNIWAASSEFSTYRLCEQRRFRQACAVSPEPPRLAHMNNESRGTFKQKARSLAPLNGLACAVKICHDGMLEDTNSLEASHMELDEGLQSKRRRSGPIGWLPWCI